MKTILATTTAMLIAAAAPAMAGDDYDKDMDDKAATMTMEEKMEKKRAMEMKLYDSATLTPATGDDAFVMIDTNANGEVDFTEFSMFMEKKGYDTTDSAKEYVKLTGGSSDVITDRTFAGVDIINLPHKHLDDGAVHNMGTMQTATTVTTQPTAVMGSTITTDSMTVGAPVTLDYSTSYGVFGDYDMDEDGRVNFNEYRKARSKAGITTTAAAQEFIRFTDGQSDFDEVRFQIAASEDVLNRGYYRSEPRM